MKVPLLDLKAQYRSIKTEVDAAVMEVLDTQHFILGPVVQALEASVAAYSGVGHACGVSSGTDALLIALMNEGIAPDDEVITTPYTFFATAGCIARVGATPVFVDIDPTTYNLDVDQIEAKITYKTKAIIPVHLFGQVADMDRVMAIAEKHNLVVIEDAAQAIGAVGHGHRAGSMGHYGCFSFFPSKNLGGAGDGGMVVMREEVRYTKLRTMRNHGASPKYYHQYVGGNFRLDALQAAVVAVKLRHLDAWTEARQRNARRYDRLFEEAGLVGAPVGLPAHPHRAEANAPTEDEERHIFNQYVIRVPRRDELKVHLRERDVGTEVYYPCPLHLQECFTSLGYGEGEFPESERAARDTLALPIYPELSDEQAAYVVASVRDFFASFS